MLWWPRPTLSFCFLVYIVCSVCHTIPLIEEEYTGNWNPKERLINFLSLYYIFLLLLAIAWLPAFCSLLCTTTLRIEANCDQAIFFLLVWSKVEDRWRAEWAHRCVSRRRLLSCILISLCISLCNSIQSAFQFVRWFFFLFLFLKFNSIQWVLLLFVGCLLVCLLDVDAAQLHLPPTLSYSALSIYLLVMGFRFFALLYFHSIQPHPPMFNILLFYKEIHNFIIISFFSLRFYEKVDRVELMDDRLSYIGLVSVATGNYLITLKSLFKAEGNGLWVTTTLEEEFLILPIKNVWSIFSFNVELLN